MPHSQLDSTQLGPLYEENPDCGSLGLVLGLDSVNADERR